MKISMYELHKQYLKILSRMNPVKIKEMLETHKGRALELNYVYETLETIYSELKLEVRDKELEEKDFPLSVGSRCLRLTISTEPLIMELSIDICDSIEYEDEVIPNCPFDRDQLDFIRDLFAEAMEKSRNVNSSNSKKIQEEELMIINVCQRMLGSDQFKNVEEFYENKSGTWSEIICK